MIQTEIMPSVDSKIQTSQMWYGTFNYNYLNCSGFEECKDKVFITRRNNYFEAFDDLTVVFNDGRYA